MSSTSRRICVIRCSLPRAIAAHRERHVDPLVVEPRVQLCAGELVLALVDRGLEPLAHRVQRHPGLAVAHLAQRLLDRALPPQVLDAHGLDRVGRGRGRGGCESLALECVGIHEGPSVPTRSPARCRPTLARVALYDSIAGIYDPWSASVVEDIAFYVDEAKRCDGPVVELAVGSGRIAVPIARAGRRVIGVDLSRGDARRSPARSPRSTASASLVDLRVGDLREPPVDERVPLVICPFRSLLHMPDEAREAPRAAGGTRLCSSRAAGSCSTSSHRAARTSRRRTGSGSSASRASSSAPTGTRAPGRCGSRCGRATSAAAMELHWLSAIEWRRLIDEAGFDVAALYGWFDRRPFRGGEDMIWVCRKREP